MGHRTVNCKVNEVKDVCEDIENNNTQDKNKIFNDKDNVIHYSSNSKGIFAQVKKLQIYISKNMQNMQINNIKKKSYF